MAMHCESIKDKHMLITVKKVRTEKIFIRKGSIEIVYRTDRRKIM